MNKVRTLMMALLCLLGMAVQAQESKAGKGITAQYFSTGMTWEEQVVMPGDEDAYSAMISTPSIYEISTDTIIGNLAYKSVLRNGSFSGMCVREDGESVWLLTNDHPTEILLYDFDWDNGKDIVTEYLKTVDMDTDDSYEVLRDTIHQSDCHTTTTNGRTYQYYRTSMARTVIQNIGKVAELNRYPCLLGYREPSVILPGMEYLKVIWVKRNGEEIFRSDNHNEWTIDVPAGIRIIMDSPKGLSQDCFDLHGRRLTAPPAKGVYIQGGRKRVAP